MFLTVDADGKIGRRRRGPRRPLVQGCRPRDHPRPPRPRPAAARRALPPQLSRSAGAATGRCSTTPPTSWFVRTTAIRDELVEKNRDDRLAPGARSARAASATGSRTSSTGRCRASRYWGTPLPIWQCDGCPPTICRRRLATPSSSPSRGPPTPADLYDRSSSIRTGRTSTTITWHCYACNGGVGTMRRVEDVIDAWFDSGAMPFAQHHYPFENARS